MPPEGGFETRRPRTALAPNVPPIKALDYHPLCPIPIGHNQYLFLHLKVSVAETPDIGWVDEVGERCAGDDDVNRPEGRNLEPERSVTDEASGKVMHL